jgi:exocyst complex component 8
MRTFPHQNNIFIAISDRRRNVRSSVADLRVLYASQMQTLHSQIEGSSKFVPTTPGRHVVAELDTGVHSLHSATYKPAHAVRFVLLDDAVLVARRRHRRNADGASTGGGGGANAGKWVAERAWPLMEMIVLETKDTPSTYQFGYRHLCCLLDICSSL